MPWLFCCSDEQDKANSTAAENLDSTISIDLLIIKGDHLAALLSFLLNPPACYPSSRITHSQSLMRLEVSTITRCLPTLKYLPDTAPLFRNVKWKWALFVVASSRNKIKLLALGQTFFCRKSLAYSECGY
ncbi:MAG TPA: hypothetical protein VF493_01180 [Terriglobales bacterium]